MKDACQQATLCQCSEFVSHAGDVTSAAAACRDSGMDATVASSHLAPSTLREPQSSVNVNDKLSSAEQIRAADIDTVCTELKECALDDAELYVRKNLSRPACDSEAENARHASVTSAVESAAAVSWAVADFFGVVGSSVSDDNQLRKQSVGGGRRKSKAGKRRVSMCGEYESESPLEVFTTPRTDINELTTIADTDEEGEYHSTQRPDPCKNERVLDAASDSDYTRDSVEPATADHVPDSLTEASADQSVFDAASLRPAAGSEPSKPAKDDHCRDDVFEDGQIDEHRVKEPTLVEDGMADGHGRKNHASVDKNR